VKVPCEAYVEEHL